MQLYYFNEEKERVYSLFLALKPLEYVHLLLITKPVEHFSKDSPEAVTESHCCWIKDLSALVHKQTTTNARIFFICDRCLNHFSSQKKVNKHRIICANMNKCAIEMPKEQNKFESFKNYKNQLNTPFIIYADTGAVLKPPETSIFAKNCFTKAHHEHKIHSIGYYFKYENDESKSRYASNRGENCLDWFANELIKIANEVFDFLRENKPMSLSEEEQKRFEEARFCHICKKCFDNNHSDIRVRDHCHISGVYRGAAHRTCNLQYQNSSRVPVVMHNMSGYDSHLLIRKLGSNAHIPGGITIIPHNSENYISFIKTIHTHSGKYAKMIKFKFIDSLRFMSASLDKLATLLSHEKKHIFKSKCIKSGYDSSELFALLVRKGVFPYEYIDNYQKLNETSLPPQKSFRSMLTDSDVSNEDYKHAQDVWGKFNIQTLGEYSDLYLKTDVLQLADVFENFRVTCHATYLLDPAHHFGAPGLSFDAMLKYTGVNIELFTDVDMLMFAERGIRGGVSQINKRYVKANNVYMNEEFDLTKESSYLLYLDGKIYIIYLSCACIFTRFKFFSESTANNLYLYGYAMSQHLPIREYRWVSESDIKQKFNTADSILSLMDDSDIGYIFEVDLHYPSKLHDVRNDFPFCPEKRAIPGVMKNEKLLLTFFDKKNYIVHYRMLKLALEHGLVLEKVHRALRFRQGAWLKPYIELNTEYRAKANSKFEKDFYKLLNNAVYGKTMENLRLRSDIRLINKWDGQVGGRSLIAQPNFKNCKIFDENLVAIEMHKSHILMNKPIVIGMCVLDISKVLMYKFLYNYLKPKYNQNVQVVYTDTDSFILEIKTGNVYADIREEPDINEFDTWDYEEGNIFGIKRHNNKVIGKFKDELAGEIATEVVGLRSKCYALRTLGRIDRMKKAKGVKKNVLQNKVSFDDYYKCVKENCIQMRKQYSIRSKNHNVYTISMEKIALNPFDDKRYIVKPDCIDTLAWGHYNLNSEKMNREYEHVKDFAQRMKEILDKKKKKKKT